MWNLKRNDATELTKKQKTYRLREGTYGCQMEMYTLLYLKCLTNKDLLYSLWDSV